ncbi:hypothetical protein C8R46DRAFT_1233837 [Mycena filopes]|nr:hypothetical protein C8R46DRAFT_1233837 [Mycena filopes]
MATSGDPDLPGWSASMALTLHRSLTSLSVAPQSRQVGPKTKSEIVQIVIGHTASFAIFSAQYILFGILGHGIHTLAYPNLSLTFNSAPLVAVAARIVHLPIRILMMTSVESNKVFFSLVATVAGVRFLRETVAYVVGNVILARCSYDGTLLELHRAAQVGAILGTVDAFCTAWYEAQCLSAEVLLGPRSFGTSTPAEKSEV